MKKLTSLMLVFILALSCVSLVACGSGEKEEARPETVPTAEREAKPSPMPEEKPASGGLTWDDMPIYPGADTDEEIWSSMSEEGGAQRETRPYWTEDSFDKVVDFYKSEMPKNGWDQMMWTDAGELANGVYSKNNDQDGAQVVITDNREGETAIQLTRLTGLQ